VPELKVDIRVPVGVSVPELADFAARCEQAGLSGVGVPDHHHTGRDAYLVLAAMATRTSTLGLYPATSNVVTRHPMVLAALANSIAELAPGRAMLTLAPGFLSVENAGEPQATRSQVGDVVRAVRGLVSHGEADYHDHTLHLTHRPDGGLGVFMLASGPKLLELAGEVADGVIMMVGLHADSVAAARECVARGARRAGRDPAEVQEILIVPIGLGEPAVARHWPRTWFRAGQQWMNYPSASNLRWLRHAGIDLARDHVPEDISPELADQVCDAFGLFGPPEYCAERLLRAREETGASHVFLFPAHDSTDNYDLPAKEVEAFGRVIGPALRAASSAEPVSDRMGGRR
jgi:5,10-methylenetetrahydromethanopterin reductase